MNVWDIIDNIEFLDITGGHIKPSVVIKRTLVVLMFLVPAFGGWMLTQAINREQATAQVFANLAGKAITQSINQSTKVSVPAPAAQPPIVHDPRYPAPVYMYPGK